MADELDQQMADQFEQLMADQLEQLVEAEFGGGYQAPLDQSSIGNVTISDTIFQDDGVVMSIGSVPIKRLRYEFIDTYVWETSPTGSRLSLEVPREDSVLVPVSTY